LKRRSHVDLRLANLALARELLHVAAPPSDGSAGDVSTATACA